MISTIRLQNFRSYRDESFEFENGVNIIVGPNGSGKTNLLEAVSVLCRGGSYRAKDVDLIKYQKPWARLDGFFEASERIVKIKKIEDSTDKTFDLNNKTYKRLNLDKTIPIVLFEPNNLQAITRGPDMRREYLDDMLCRSQPGYKALSSRYRRTLAQRNSLLKQTGLRVNEQLFAWDVRLSEMGAQIAKERFELVEKINKRIGKAYSGIAGHKTKVEVSYAATFPADVYGSKMLSRLGAERSKDMERGFTGCGPHREDIELKIAGKPIVISASRGETRSLMLALKILELELITNARGQKPLLLLDDVFSELDGARRRALVDYLAGHQTIITTTEADAVIEYFTEKSSLIPLN